MLEWVYKQNITLFTRRLCKRDLKDVHISRHGRFPMRSSWTCYLSSSLNLNIVFGHCYVVQHRMSYTDLYSCQDLQLCIIKGHTLTFMFVFYYFFVLWRRLFYIFLLTFSKIIQMNVYRQRKNLDIQAFNCTHKFQNIPNGEKLILKEQKQPQMK